MLTIIVTGTPGTGKTTLAKAISKEFKLSYVDVNTIIKKYKTSEGFDRKRKSKIVDIKKLNKALIKEINDYKLFIKKSTIIESNIKKTIKNNRINNKSKNNNKLMVGVVIDSHLSHYLPKKYVDICIVTKCKLKKLESRLKKRKYSKNKMRENLDSEIFDVCLTEAKENKHKIIIVDTTKAVDIKKLLKKI